MTVALGRRASDVRVIGLISLAHGSSHFFYLVPPSMFPWLKDAFALSYAELGLLMSIFFVTSCIIQAASGFLVDRIGARPVLFAGVSLLALALLHAWSNRIFGLGCCTSIYGCITQLSDWRTAFLSAALLEVIILLILWVNKSQLLDNVHERHARQPC